MRSILITKAKSVTHVSDTKRHQSLRSFIEFAHDADEDCLGAASLSIY